MTDWICLIVTLPQRSGTLRMRGWRALKAAGAAVLRDGVYLLPARLACRDAMEQVAVDVRSGGGSAYVLGVDEPEGTRFIALFDRTTEHHGLQAQIERALRSLDVDGPQDAARVVRTLRRSFANLAAIDYFANEQQQRSAASLERLEQRLRQLVAPDEPAASCREIERWELTEFQGRRWATRARPWVDRLASAWLILRIIDPAATFLWLRSPADCPPDAIGFDFDGAGISHVGELVTYEVLLAGFGLTDRAELTRIGAIVHALDVGGPAPVEVAGIERILAGLREANADDDALMTKANDVFDALMAAFEHDAQHKQRTSP